MDVWEITPEDAKARLDSGEKLFLVDFPEPEIKLKEPNLMRRPVVLRGSQIGLG